MSLQNETKSKEEYLKSLGDEIEGFYTCKSDSRAYNF